ncbi:MAG TPA: 2-dehydropantoate 2-reductase N-terminal domain-containing protein, partial [Rhizomicrobium sp.]|nr:2-dehydropantoate 2-reductase N-terminal domain-containing protein [Rhizomicrobium sp.]
MARIALIGPGAIGGTAAAALCENGNHALTICANRTFDTLSLTRSDKNETKHFPVQVVTSLNGLSPFDWVILAVKSHQTAGAADWLRAAVGPQTKLAILQNGVEHRERVRPFVPPDIDIVPVVVQLPAERTAPGAITTYGPPLLIVGDDPSSRAFADLFTGSFMHLQIDPDFRTRQWEKLCLNAASGSLITLTMNPDCIATVPGMRDLCKAIVDECVSVGRAEGARFDDGFSDNLANMLAA